MQAAQAKLTCSCQYFLFQTRLCTPSFSEFLPDIAQQQVLFLFELPTKKHVIRLLATGVRQFLNLIAHSSLADATVALQQVKRYCLDEDHVSQTNFSKSPKSASNLIAMA
jgi:hypothetical protein